MVQGLTYISFENKVYEGCILGKQHRVPFPLGLAWRAQPQIELIHSDLCGPMKTQSINGRKYFFLILDDYKRMNRVYFLKEKKIAFKALVENMTGYFIKTLRTNRGGEFLSNQFDSFCKHHGLFHNLQVVCRLMAGWIEYLDGYNYKYL